MSNHALSLFLITSSNMRMRRLIPNCKKNSKKFCSAVRQKQIIVGCWNFSLSLTKAFKQSTVQHGYNVFPDLILKHFFYFVYKFLGGNVWLLFMNRTREGQFRLSWLRERFQTISPFQPQAAEQVLYHDVVVPKGPALLDKKFSQKA